MTTETEMIMFQMDANMRRLEKSLKQGVASTSRDTRAIQKQMDTTAKRIELAMSQSGSSIERFTQGLNAVAPALAAAFSADAVVKYADGYTQLTNQLKVAGLAGENLKQVENALYDAANRNGVAVNSLAQVYGRVSVSANELGASQQDLLKFTDTVSNAIRVQGSSVESASGALLQLSQGLGAGTLRAEEFNSVLEGLPVLAQAIAKNLDGAGGSVARLRALVLEGKVSSVAAFNAILKASADLEAQASKSNLTIGASMQILNNQIGRYVGQTAEGLSATQRMSQGIQLLANNLDTVAPAVILIASVLAGRYANAAAASTIETLKLSAAQVTAGISSRNLTTSAVAGAVAMRGLSAAMAFFGGPIGLAITTVGAALTYVAMESAKTKAEMESLRGAGNELEGMAKQYGVAVSDAANKTRDAASASRDAAGAARDQANSLDAVRISANNAARAIQFLTAQQRQQKIEEYGKGLKATDTAIRGRNPFTTNQEERTNTAKQNLSNAVGGGSTFFGASADQAIARARKNLTNLPKATQELFREYDQQRQILAEMLAQEAADKKVYQALLAARGTPTIQPPTPQTQTSGSTTVPTATAPAGAKSKSGSLTSLVWMEVYKNDAISLDYEIRQKLDPAMAMIKARYEGVDKAADDLQLSVSEGFEIMATDAERFGISLAEDLAYAFGDAIGRSLDLGDAFEDVIRRMVAITATSGLLELFGVTGNGKSTGGGLLGLLKGNGLTDINKDGSRGVSLGSILSGLPGIGGLFGGKRAGGGPVQAGKLYQVNDGGGQKEFFAAQMDGRIMTAAQMNADLSRPMQAQQPVYAPSFHFDNRGAVMTQDIIDQMNAIGRQAAVAGAVNGSQLAQTAVARRQQRSLR